MVDVLSIIIGACIITAIWLSADSLYSRYQRHKAEKAQDLLLGNTTDLSFKELDDVKLLNADIDLNAILVESTPTAVDGKEMWVHNWSDGTISVTDQPFSEWIIHAEDDFYSDSGVLASEAPASILTQESVGVIPPAPEINPNDGFTPPE